MSTQNGTNGKSSDVVDAKADKKAKDLRYVTPIEAKLPRIETKSVFAAYMNSLFRLYSVRIEFRGRVMGGTPQDPRLIEGWIRKNMGVEREEELLRLTLQTMMENGEEFPEGVDPLSITSFEELEAISKKIAGKKQTNGFKKAPEIGLYLEGRVIKAAIKENTNILFAGTRWGPTMKGPKSFVAERVFVVEDKIPFIRGPLAPGLTNQDPDGVELFIGHVTGPKGPQSNITYYQYVEEPAIEFHVMVLKDEVDPNHWPQIWVASQENGLGALRSQSFGKFDVTKWQQLEHAQFGMKEAERIVEYVQVRDAVAEERQKESMADAAANPDPGTSRVYITKPVR